MYKKEFDLQSDGFTSEVELMTDIQDIANATLPREKEDFVLTVSETKVSISYQWSNIPRKIF